jgi:hypothetical protein
MSGLARSRRLAVCLARLSMACLCLTLMSPISFGSNSATQAASAPSRTLDYQVKAAMLYRFLGYTEWPDSAFVAPEAPYRICVLGARNIESELRNLVAGRAINGRSIEVGFASQMDQIGEAHLVFVAIAQESLLPALGRAAQSHAWLLVTENEAGLPPASAINLRLLDSRVGFDISVVNAQKAGLKFSSRLLAVAASVQESERP